MIKKIIFSLLIFFSTSSFLSFAKVPIVYHPQYDLLSSGPLEICAKCLHDFDPNKYSQVYNYLVKSIGIKEDQFYTPEIVTEEDLLLVHSKEYLTTLNDVLNIIKIAGLPINRILMLVITIAEMQNRLLTPMRYGTGGTILGCELALEYGWAINLSGGYHHAKPNFGGGLCFFNDIAIAIHKLRLSLKRKNDHFDETQFNVLIVDLDAHQGNGHEEIFMNDPNVFIFDIYNCLIYPKDEHAKAGIKFNYPVESGIDDDLYMKILMENLPEAIEQARPNLIIYNAGTDPFVEDSLGEMNVSKVGLIHRDEIVFKAAKAQGIPILMVLSGGYSKQSAEIISHSIENLFKKEVLRTP